MQRLFYAILCITIALAAGACSDGSEIQLTLVNQNVALSTEIAGIRSTATYAADSLDITAEYVQTAVRQATEQYGILFGTLAAAGIDASIVQPGAALPTQLPVVQSPAAQTTNLVPNTTTGTPNPLVTPPAASGAGAGVQGQPSLYNIVTASGVGSNDCALGSVTSFSASTTQIYVVATAASIPANTTLSSRWFSAGVEVVAHTFTPDFDIEQNCIWFYIDQADTPFTPGSWSVQLEINGQIAGQPVTFSITE